MTTTTEKITNDLSFRPEEFGCTPQPERRGPAVYRAIAAVIGDLAREGIGKDRRNQQQGFMFRGIDDVYNALASLLARHGLVVLPRVLQRHHDERTTKSGGAMFTVTVEVAFDFVATEDGSRHTVITWGEAMDTADKATNKAMSAAYKYACLQGFCIPTEGDNDADATTPEPVAPKAQPKPQAQAKPQPQPQQQQQQQRPASRGQHTPEQDKRIGQLSGQLGMSRPALMDLCKEVCGRMLGADMSAEQADTLIKALEGLVAERGAA